MTLSLLEVLLQEPGYLLFILFLAALTGLLFAFNYKKTVRVGPARLRLLAGWALAYMLLPCVLFAASLPAPGVIRAALAGVLIYYFIKTLRALLQDGIFKEEPEYEIRLDFMLLFLGLLVFIYAPLFYGRGFLWDWGKHRGVLLCLYAAPLNPELNYFGLPEGHALQNSRLVYYYAMYLPAVYAAKAAAFFWQAASFKALTQLLSVFFFIWNMLGMALAALLLPLACAKLFDIKNKIAWGYFYLLLIVFSNLGYWQLPFITDHIPGGRAAAALAEYHARFGSFWKTWQWGPPQLIAALFSVVLLALFSRLRQFPLLLWSAFLLSCSAFVWLASVPVYLYLFVAESLKAGTGHGFRANAAALLKGKKTELTAAAFFAVLIIIFYAGKTYPESLVINPSLLADNGFIKYLIFLVPQLLPTALVLWLCKVAPKSVPGVVWLAAGLLVILPLFELGFSNDLAMKGGVPLLLILNLFCAAVCQQEFGRLAPAAKIASGVFLLLVAQGFIFSCLTSLASESALVESNLQVIRQYAGSGSIWPF